MNAKKHGKVTMALAMIGGLAALSIAYAAISTQLNIKTGDKTEQVETSAVKFTGVEAQGVSKVTTSSGVTTTSPTEFEGGGVTTNDAASCGTGVISDGAKDDDTVTISGTILRDYGAFAVYKLTIKNEGGIAAKLASSPNKFVDDKIADTNDVINFTSGTDDKLRGNITIKVYSNVACDNPVDAWKESDGNSTSANYIEAGGSTEWYVKVAHRTRNVSYSGVADEYTGDNLTDLSGFTDDLTSGAFGFTITPVWENV